MNLINMFFSLFFRALLCIPVLVMANEWSSWRGPLYNGSAGTNASLPESFGPNESIAWKTKLPGPSAGTPIVLKDRVFLSSVETSSSDEQNGRLLALCLDRKTGGILWRKNAGSGYRAGNDGFTHQLHARSNYASPSPVANDERVIFFYGNGDLVSFTHNGSEEWRRNLQKDYGDFCFQWTFSASPTLLGERLYLPILQRDEKVHGRGKDGAQSFFLCMDASTGKTIWKKVRNSPAKKESLESFGTIIPNENQILIAGGDVLTGHDPKTGRELWRWGTWNPGHRQEWWRLVPSPVVGDGVILVCAPKKAPIFAVSAKLSGVHDGKDGLVWDTAENPELTSDVPTPAFYKGHFYVLSDLRKTLCKVDPKSGKIRWSLPLPGKYKWRSSPSVGDDKIYFMNHNGEVLVVSVKDGKILNHAKMGGTYDDNTRSSIALAGNQLFIRTNENLYCIE